MPEASDSPSAGPALGPAGLAVFNAVFWPYLFATTALAFVPTLALWALKPFDPKKTLLRRFTEEWGAHYLERIPFAGVEVTGRDRLDFGRPYVFVANHASMVDILAMSAARIPALWVSKQENFYAPFLGWNMYLNDYISVRRNNIPSIMRMVRTCLARLREGRSIFIFPEGTRSEDGSLRPFHRGAFVLAARAGVPVVPICLSGTREVLKKGSFMVYPGRVKVSILGPIDPSEAGGDSRRLRDHVRDLMGRELARMRGEA
jgi:1-acyl-sn-glycerol-3-phosphate acyltransferase